jgi:hypothetical protein
VCFVNEESDAPSRSQPDVPAAPALRAVSDALLERLDLLAALEIEKRGLGPDDPRLVEVAEIVRDLAGDVLEYATTESDLTEVVHAMASSDEPDAPTRSLEQEGPRPLHVIVDEWRAAMRLLAAAPPASAQAARATIATRELRAEFERASAAGNAPHRED